jgi:hypothetical protein
MRFNGQDFSHFFWAIGDLDLKNIYSLWDRWGIYYDIMITIISWYVKTAALKTREREREKRFRPAFVGLSRDDT